jgi:hypothetical protein
MPTWRAKAGTASDWEGITTAVDTATKAIPKAIMKKRFIMEFPPKSKKIIYIRING